jgi:hypothetical protein
VKGLTVGRQLNVLMKEFYKNDPAKLTEWAILYQHPARRARRKKSVAEKPG